MSTTPPPYRIDCTEGSRNSSSYGIGIEEKGATIRHARKNHVILTVGGGGGVVPGKSDRNLKYFLHHERA